jgi:hypothetical protein
VLYVVSQFGVSIPAQSKMLNELVSTIAEANKLMTEKHRRSETQSRADPPQQELNGQNCWQKGKFVPATSFKQ